MIGIWLVMILRATYASGEVDGSMTTRETYPEDYEESLGFGMRREDLEDVWE